MNPELSLFYHRHHVNDTAEEIMLRAAQFRDLKAIEATLAFHKHVNLKHRTKELMIDSDDYTYYAYNVFDYICCDKARWPPVYKLFHEYEANRHKVRAQLRKKFASFVKQDMADSTRVFVLIRMCKEGYLVVSK